MTRSRISHSNIANVPNLGRRNVIINGAQNIDQRGYGHGASSYTIGSTGNIYTIDRWATFVSAGSKIGVAQVDDVPNSDFKYSAKITSLAATTIGSGDYYGYNTALEVNDVQHFGFGTSSPKQFTISFWVKSTLTGNFGLAVRVKPSSPARSFPTTYTINAANTWEYKTLTLTAESNTAWTAQGGTGSGFSLWFDLGTGSNFHQTANQYYSGNATAPSGTVQLAATNAATWQITGVQVELGAVATDFEYRSFAQELALCQRYYQKSYDYARAPGYSESSTGSHTRMWLANRNSSTPHYYNVFTGGKMRTAPSVTNYNPYDGAINEISNYDNGPGNNAGNYISRIGEDGYTTYANSQTLGHFMAFHFTADAEL